MSLPHHDASGKLAVAIILASGILIWLGSGGVDLIDYPGVTSNDQFDRTATDLTVFDRRIPSGRGVHKRGKDRSTVRADHLDVFFEVHERQINANYAFEPDQKRL